MTAALGMSRMIVEGAFVNLIPVDIAIALAVGGAVFMVASVMGMGFQRIRREMATIVEADGVAVSEDPSARPQTRLHVWRHSVTMFLTAIVQMVGRIVKPFVREAWSEKLRKRFAAMGRPKYRPEDFLARQVLFAGLFAVLGLALMLMMRRGAAATVLLTPLFGAAGFLMPHVWLRDHIVYRQKQIWRAMPYHLDLLTLALEAGLDFGQALGTVVEKGRTGPLREELSIAVSEMKLGKTREEALRNLAERVQVPEISSLTSSILQADRMGTSLGRVLRIQGGQMRVVRMQRAEKSANEAPVKMLLPLILCFFPTVFIILFGPILFRVMGLG